MRNAKEVYDDGVKKGYIGKDIKEKGSLANFNVVLDSLRSDEDVLFGFNGFISEGDKGKKMGEPSSFVVTNKRLVWGRKIAFTSECQSLDLDNLETTSFAKHSPYTNFGAITIKTIANQYVISMGLKAAEEVNSVLPNALQELKNKSKETVTPVTSAADEILKFKSLLDMGAITQEEFDAKKKQLLGL